MVRTTVLSDEELDSLEFPVLFMAGENEKTYSPRNVIERLNSVAPRIKTRLQAISKKGFWFKIAAGVKINPEAYSSILRI
jgi:hypothetical protein